MKFWLFLIGPWRTNAIIRFFKDEFVTEKTRRKYQE